MEYDIFEEAMKKDTKELKYIIEMNKFENSSKTRLFNSYQPERLSERTPEREKR